ncbi:hypothetical protein EQ832_08525 [Pseudomonas sp. ALS1131]|nr:hypothetical protein [Pseudomonas sp. ALS1131]TRO40103.1 hypothetical protein EQ832_08525 [Pseudomonas sp. ALS1131]
MSRYMVLGVMCVALLVGCGEEEIGDVKIVPPQSEHQVSETAIYFPDGVGIDFGLMPVKDNIREEKDGKRSRVVVYEFSKYTPEHIDIALSEVFKDGGYIRKEIPSREFDLSVQYRKENIQNVRAQYKVRLREGFDKRTVLTIFWRIPE